MRWCVLLFATALAACGGSASPACPSHEIALWRVGTGPAMATCTCPNGSTKDVELGEVADACAVAVPMCARACG